MGKQSNNHDEQLQNLDLENPESSQPVFRSCSSVLFRLFSLKCVILLVLSFAVLLSVIFWFFPIRPLSDFDADEMVKLNASVQAYFRLHKPASQVISHKERLEYDISQSIGLLNTKVTVLSLHKSDSYNYTDVEFTVLPDRPHNAITNHSLDLLRSSFVSLFTKRSKLNLTSSSFGDPTYFQVLKFPQGITMDLIRSIPVPGVLEFSFSFTLGISLSEVQYSLDQLYGILKHELLLKHYESLHFLFTNEYGSTIASPVTVQANVVTTKRHDLKKRFKQFAEITQRFSGKNLGLENSEVGEVKSISFSPFHKEKMIDSGLGLAPEPAS